MAKRKPASKIAGHIGHTCWIEGGVCTDHAECLKTKGCEKHLNKIAAAPDSSYFEAIEMGGVLDRAKEIVDGRDRQQHYGPPDEFMGRLAKMWSGYLGTRIAADLAPRDAAMMMALLKAARLSTNPDHDDSLVDFAGYAHIFSRLKEGK